MKTQYMKSMLVGAAIAFAGAGTSVNATPFTDDIATSIDMGLAWFDGQGAYTYPASGSFNTDATGLAVLALLEKRPPLNPLGAPLGYQNSAPADKDRILRAIRSILDNHSGAGFYAYRDGQDLMALSAYILTGGPDQGNAAFATATGGQPAVNLKTAFNQIFDRINLNQSTVGTTGVAGYWCYTDPFCNDSSTTQLVVAGLAAARSVYSTTDPLYQPIYNDVGRLAALNTLTATSQTAYQTGGTPGGAGGDLSVAGHPEKGHGYNRGWENSLQQTASGTWIQLVGGGVDINETNVQSYLQWLANRYRYTNAGSNGEDGGWSGLSHYYYLWSSSKAFAFLEQSGVTPNPGNVTPVAPTPAGAVGLGTVAPGNAPAFVGREVHRDPATDTRILVGQAPTPGYYSAENKRWYYDYAYTLLSNQDAAGQYHNPGWDATADQAYALLVLQRATGNACVDTDLDGVCDIVDNCPSVRNPSQAAHSALNSVGDACQNRCDVNGDKAISSADVNSIKAMLNKPAAFVSDPRDANLDGKINILDAAICGKNVGKWHPIAGLNNPTWPELAP